MNKNTQKFVAARLAALEDMMPKLWTAIVCGEDPDRTAYYIDKMIENLSYLHRAYPRKPSKLCLESIG